MLKEAVGRGPTNARTFLNEDLVLVILEDTLTTAERTLADEDRVELVREMRRAFSVSMTERMKELIAEQLGRPVRAVFGDHSVLPDYAFVAFILEPGGDQAGKDGGGAAPALSTAPRNAATAETRDRQREISRRLVGMFKELQGRGPRDARTYLEEDVVIVLLGETLTPVEQAMAGGESASSGDIMRIRRVFQHLMSEKAKAMVAEVTGRPVAAMLSDNSVFPDYAVEVFLLGDAAPAAGAGSPGSA